MSRVYVYEILARPAPGLARILADGDFSLWTRVRLRKDTKCDATGTPLKKGSYGYAPVGNQMYRMCRLSPDYVESIPLEPSDG